MSDKVKPALTREEWADWFSHHGTAEDRSVFFALHRRDEYPAMDTVEVNRARAACALQLSGPDGKPLFTREDVDVIRHALLAWDGFGDRGDGETDWVSPKYPSADTLVDRLSSLLPPEEP